MTNGDKYKTAQERAEAMTKWCDERWCENCVLHEHGVKSVECAFNWLYLECEEESFEDVVEEMRKRMIDREHSPSLWPFVERLEAAHNRVAKKCREGKE